MQVEGQELLWWSNVQKLENKFQSYFKVKHAISVNSWTSGLHVAVDCLDMKPGSEIICSPWSMSATVASISKATDVFHCVCRHKRFKNIQHRS